MTIEHEISERYARLPSSNFAKILKMAVEGKNVISLGPGEPDFTTPEHIRNAAIMAIDKGYTHYSPPAGRTETKQAIAKKLRKDNKINVSPDEIVVTCGSQEALFLATLSLIDPGEKMIVPNPGFLAFIPMVETLTGVPVSIPLREENGFEFDPEELEKLIDRRTRIILINSPSNPTGGILKRKTLEKLADIAIQHDLVIFSDEAYEKLLYDNKKHISIASLNGMKERVLTFQSFSKTYAMAGFRLGYVAGPKDLIQAMTRLHIYTTVCAPTVSQLAAIEALAGDQSCVREMRKEYDRRRKLITKRLGEIPKISCLKPEGAFYAFPNITGLRMSSVQAANFFLKKAKVLVVPGTEFGKYGEGYVRMSYATGYEKIEEAMNRIERVVKRKR
ncbi:MAG: pyridoxal phosphate-dependent aminotransferase [Candidatus Aenigmarchaeota archaeon]|nr:pyridoxal phosphate-dependent aminotransferase [Candidatus Aenigmarchaeota archaeon]